MSAPYPSFEEIKEVDRKLTAMRKQYYEHHDLFSFQWWLLLLVLIVPWIIWWRLVDKSRIKEILLFGTTMTIVVVLLDDIGGQLGWWSYPYELVRIIPRMNAIDYGALPVIHMLVYQYFRSWRSYVVANVIMALAFSFIAEPIAVWLGVYKMDHWHHAYSFPIYIAKAVFIRALLERLTGGGRRAAVNSE